VRRAGLRHPAPDPRRAHPAEPVRRRRPHPGHHGRAGRAGRRHPAPDSHRSHPATPTLPNRECRAGRLRRSPAPHPQPPHRNRRHPRRLDQVRRAGLRYPAPDPRRAHLAEPVRRRRPHPGHHGRAGRAGRCSVVAGVGSRGEVGRRGAGVPRSGASGARSGCARRGRSWPEVSPWTQVPREARAGGPRGRGRRSRVGGTGVRQGAAPTWPAAGPVREPAGRRTRVAAREPRYRVEDRPSRIRHLRRPPLPRPRRRPCQPLPGPRPPRRPHPPGPPNRPVPSPTPRRSGRPGCPGPVWGPCRRWSRTAAPTSRPRDRWAFPPAGSCPQLSTAWAV
jgi:hypothetical protein